MTKDYPSKLYYSISEVAQITGIKAHVLRYWETEFPTLKPRKTRTGSRRFRQVDIEEVLAIKHLLYDEGFKIAGARKLRRQERGKPAEDAGQPAQLAIGFDALDDRAKLEHVKNELQRLLELVRELGRMAVKSKEQATFKEMEEEG